MLPFAKAWLGDAVAQAQAMLGPTVLDRAWRAGQAMAPDAAVTEAVRELRDRLTTGRPPASEGDE
jgi:hypothetical protein